MRKSGNNGIEWNMSAYALHH